MPTNAASSVPPQCCLISSASSAQLISDHNCCLSAVSVSISAIQCSLSVLPQCPSVLPLCSRDCLESHPTTERRSPGVTDHACETPGDARSHLLERHCDGQDRSNAGQGGRTLQQLEFHIQDCHTRRLALSSGGSPNNLMQHDRWVDDWRAGGSRGCWVQRLAGRTTTPPLWAVQTGGCETHPPTTAGRDGSTSLLAVYSTTSGK